MSDPSAVPNRAEIVGPFTARELVVRGYTVPGVQAIEEDGGRVLFLVDHRLGYSVAAADFEEVACLVADVYALGLGLSCHPQAGADSEEKFREDLRRIPMLLRPRRLIGLEGVPEHVCEGPDPDDPRTSGT